MGSPCRLCKLTRLQHRVAWPTNAMGYGRIKAISQDLHHCNTNPVAWLEGRVPTRINLVGSSITEYLLAWVCFLYRKNHKRKALKGKRAIFDENRRAVL